MVSSQIINRLYDADLVIADLSFHNANAFYEMALRHAVNKPIIHMVRKGENIPFDVITHRAIQFLVTTPGEQQKARDALLPAIEAAFKDGFEPENPVQHARGRQELLKNATPDQRILIERLEAAEARLSALEIPRFNALAGIISHPFLVRVKLEEGGPQAYQAFSDTVAAKMPDVAVRSLGYDECEVAFTSTTKGSERVTTALATFPLVQDVSAPMRPRKSQADLF